MGNTFKNKSSMQNTHRDFIGLSGLKKEHCAQVRKFEEWSKRGYEDFHHNHYDWWAFPSDQPSSYGFKYVVLSEDIDELKQDKGFMARFKRGLELTFESWGWNLSHACELPRNSLSIHQRWQVNLLLKSIFSHSSESQLAALADKASQSFALGQVVWPSPRIRKHDAICKDSSSARRILLVKNHDSDPSRFNLLCV